MADKLAAVTSRLGKSYVAWKTAEKKKEKDRQDFFDLAIEQVDKSALAQMTVTIPTGAVANDDEVIAWLAEKYPKWTLVKSEIRPEYIRAIIQEDPKYKPVTYINPTDKMVYTRQVQEGSPYLDDNALKAEDYALWVRVSEETRTLKDIATLPAEDLAALQGYFRFKKPVVKLAAPRKAKPEELNEDN